MTTDGPAPAPSTEGVPAGWYPDPVDEAKQRYFDGEAWTTQVATRPGHTPPPPRRRYGRWVTLSLVGVLAIAVAVVALVRGSGDTEPGEFPTIVIAEQEEEPTGTEVETEPEVEAVDGGQVTAGEDIQGAIDTGQRWQVTMEVPEDALVLLDARPVPAGGGDLMLFAYEDDGEQFAGNDDRGELSRIGGDELDPVLVLGLPAGSIDLEVGSWLDESSTEFELRTILPERIDTEFDESWELDAGATQMRTLEVTESGSYLVEVMAEGGAHGFFIDTNTGEVATWGSGAEHISEELQLDPGTHLLIASRDGLDAGGLQLRISPA